MLRVSLATCAAVLLSVAPASAAITLDYSGTTILITGTGDNATFVGFDSGDSTVTVRNSTGVTNNASECIPEDVPTLGTYFHCPGAAETVQATYAAGTDSFQLEAVCVPTVTVALGDGTNEFTGEQGCPDNQVATVTGGGGEDWIIGGPGPDALDGGGGPDRVLGRVGVDAVHGGDGADQLEGNEGNDQLAGDGGEDVLAGGPGEDTVDGGENNDTLEKGDTDYASSGNDDVRGGGGGDLLDLDGAAGGASISLDDVANDGPSGAADNYHSDIESVLGTRGDDTYAGTPGNDGFRGNLGRDTAHGLAGDDRLDGDSDDDQLFGDAGADTVYGGSANDVVDGGDGTDSLFGDSDACSAYGCPSGNDQIRARDGVADAINCGSGADTAEVDQLDVLGADGFQLCETIDRATVAAPPGAGPGPGPSGPGGDESRPAPTLPKGARAKRSRKRVTVKVKGKLGLPATVSAAQGCSGDVALTLMRGKKTLAEKTTAVTSKCAYEATLKVKRSKVGKAKRVKLKVAFAGNDAVAPLTVTHKHEVS